MERELTARHVFVGFVEGVKSGIRNAEFATLFLLLFVENHFAFTIFFVSLFLKLWNVEQEVSEVFLACSRH